MYRGLILFTLLLSGMAAAEDSLHIYYYNGQSIEQMRIRGVTITVTLKDTGKLNQVAVYVDNASPDAVNVIPSNFALHQTSPKDEDLALKSDAEVQKIAGQRALFGHVVAAVGAGIKTTNDKLSGNESEPAAETPSGYDAQARWLAHVDELGQRGQTAALGRLYLRGSTVFPGAKYSGVLWFDRHDALGNGVVRVTLGLRNYQFPFPPPEWATTPSKPDQANQDADKSSASKPASGHPSAHPSGEPESGGSSSKTGVLGVAGESWADGGMSGVKIVDVAQNSAAELAGLRPGYVITNIDTKRITSTEDLAAALAQKAPGARVTIDYLFHTGLGWMAKQTVVILASGD